MNKQQIRDMLEMQNSCNAVAITGKIDGKWQDFVYLHQLSFDHFSYSNALIVELGEFLTEVGYKWWKQTTPNIEHAKMELIDVFHFLLSMVLVDIEVADDFECGKIQDAYLKSGDYYESLGNRRNQQQICGLCVSSMALHAGKWAERVRHDGPGHVKLSEECSNLLIYFFIACRAIGLSPKELYRTYVGKNVLNVFRYENGFKDGTYEKRWFKRGNLPDDGLEDNEVLNLVLNKLGDEASAAEIKGLLTKLYAKRNTGVTALNQSTGRIEIEGIDTWSKA